MKLASTKFNCPHCNKEYDDYDDQYLDQMNEGNNWTVNIKCSSCENTFGMTYSMVGDAVGFEL